MGNESATDVNEVPAGSTSIVPRVVVDQGAGAGRGLALSSRVMTVGRHPSNDLAIDDAHVSNVHAELRRVGPRVRVRDAGSSNGTWLGGTRIVEAELEIGSVIRVGSTLLRIASGEERAQREPVTPESFGGAVGRSAVMRDIFATLSRLAPKPLALLVHGETGTGKEELARAVHSESPRKDAPFVVIDATSLPATLEEALLFGHEKGAFAGALEARAGLFEAATGGTLFIDEVGELPTALQAKLLRVLERNEVVRVGGLAPVRVDLRVIAATQRDLRHEIEAGRFREDLFYRLAQVQIRLPPLRDRVEDIPIIASKLLQSMARDDKPWFLDQGALSYLAAQSWPGNVRELRNVLLRAVALAQDDIIRRTDVSGEGVGFRGTREERDAMDLSGTFGVAKQRAIERFESAYLSALVKRCGGNLSAAAREADIARHHLRELLKRRGLYAPREE